MSSDVFTIPWTGTVTNAGGDTDLWEVAPADDHPVQILGFSLGQISEVGDTAEEGLRISVIRLPATFTSGSGGSSGTPRCVSTNGVSPSFSSEVNNTTVATTSGTAETLLDMAWNERNSPFEVWLPEPDLQFKAIQAQGLVVRCQTTAADDLTFAGTLWVREL